MGQESARLRRSAGRAPTCCRAGDAHGAGRASLQLARRSAIGASGKASRSPGPLDVHSSAPTAARAPTRVPAARSSRASAAAPTDHDAGARRADRPSSGDGIQIAGKRSFRQQFEQQGRIAAIGLCRRVSSAFRIADGCPTRHSMAQLLHQPQEPPHRPGHFDPDDHRWRAGWRRNPAPPTPRVSTCVSIRFTGIAIQHRDGLLRCV